MNYSASVTGNWNIEPSARPTPPRPSKPTLAIGTRLVHKFDGRTGTIVGKVRIVPSRPGGMPGPTVFTIRYDGGGFDASGSTSWVRSRFKLLKGRS